MKTFIENEDGSTAVEMALLFPVILAFIMFALFINMFYESKIATSVGANEALRYAVTQKSYRDAKDTAHTNLLNVYKQHNIKLEEFNLIYEDTNHDNKYSIGDKITIKIKTKKGVWCHHDYELQGRVEDDSINRGK